MSEAPHRPSVLASLPNGEAVRAEEVRRILIEPAPAPPRLEGQRFSVVVEFAAGERRVIATGLARPEALDLARRCARALQEAEKPTK
ncbi:MAG: hypothetical protein N2038_07625 [Geminicoccaceae bacterium]|nr:hypothetical protein [Geminicoccaceae bacterium]MCS7266656.1 hypothetical protein [Geminicoccaceae bacterium]MCX7630104.1 hypothetical protein [Geminicoccaceae bacterium]MDW8123289.1 hypothetical protein [Geminicoccaceae bacterium]MDW8340410.1 hypothetical protein [Geminicoccaceae bacterium]